MLANAASANRYYCTVRTVLIATVHGAGYRYEE